MRGSRKTKPPFLYLPTQQRSRFLLDSSGISILSSSQDFQHSSYLFLENKTSPFPSHFMGLNFPNRHVFCRHNLPSGVFASRGYFLDLSVVIQYSMLEKLLLLILRYFALYESERKGQLLNSL